MLFIRIYLVSSFLSLTFLLVGQGTSWQEDFYQSNRADDLQKMVEDWEGNLAMIGNTNGWGAKGEDILFWKIDPSASSTYLKNIARNRIGTKEDERAFAITKTFDGGYLIAGHTTTRLDNISKGRDPLLIKLDEFGEPLYWYDEVKAIGGKENDALHDVLLQEDGSIIAVGHLGSSVLVVKIEPNGTVIHKTFYGYKSTAFAVTSNKLDELVLTGEWGNDLKKEIFITKVVFTNDNFEIVWEYKGIKKPKAKINRGLDITSLSSGGYAVVSEGINEYRERKICLITIPEHTRRRGTKAKTYFLESGGESGGTAISETFNNNLLLSGYNNGHQRGARRNRGWVQLVNQKGQNVWKEQGLSFGNKQEDNLKDIIQTSEGKIFAAGYTNSTEGLSEDAWMVQIDKTIYPPSIADQPDLSIGDFKFGDANQNDTLDANERGYLIFKVKNNGDKNITNVKAKIDASVIRGLKIPKTVVVEKIPAGQTTLVSIPLQGLPNIVSHKCQVNLTLLAAEKIIAQTDTPASFLTERAPLPDLQIIQLKKPTIKETVFQRKKEITLKVKVQNIGKIAANQVLVKFVFPYKTKALGIQSFPVGDLQPGQSIEKSITFKALSIYESEQIKVRCVAKETSYGIVFNQQFNFQLLPFDKDFGELNKGFIEKGGQSKHFLSYQYPIQPETVRWILDDEDRQFLTAYRQKQVSLKAVLFSNEELSLDDITIAAVSEDQQFKVVIDAASQLNLTDDVSFYYPDLAANHKYHHRIVVKQLPLTIGNNQVYFELKGKKNEPIETITRVPVTGNLHLYTFGIPYQQADLRLKFTTKDAEEFANAFDNQAGERGLYYKIFNDQIYTRQSNTTGDSLRFHLEQIENDFLMDDIQENDAILLFFSGHGETRGADNNFYLLGSNYTPRTRRATSLDFRNYILDVLNGVQCRNKLIFIDACHSAAATGSKGQENDADKELSQAMIRLANSEDDYHFFLSCREGQSSYEDTDWQNGAYTQALLEIFQQQEIHNDPKGKEKAKLEAITEGHTILNSEIIQAWLTYRVPKLVQTKKGKSAQQEPILLSQDKEGEDLGNDLPIYLLKKQLRRWSKYKN